MKKYIFLPILLIGLASCTPAGLKKMTKKELASATPPNRTIYETNSLPKEIVYIKPAQQTKVKSNVVLTDGKGEKTKYPLEIILKEEPTTNYFKFEAEKKPKDNSFWLSGNFLLLYYGTLAPLLFGVWIWFKNRKKNK